MKKWRMLLTKTLLITLTHLSRIYKKIKEEIMIHNYKGQL
jgi:hypothetical protein